MRSNGKRFRELVAQHTPLPIVGTINAGMALLAKQAGFSALYLSGAGVANASLGTPDLGITTLHDVLIDANRIIQAVDLPVLVDIDTGWGGAFNIERAIRECTQIGIAAVHMEDQVSQKRCGHRPNKQLVNTQEMCDRIFSAVSAKTDPDFVIMARTDALAVEGLEATLARVRAYHSAGADMIFAEAVTDLNHYQTLRHAAPIPILANMTEWGKTPQWTLTDFKQAGVDMVLYPLGAQRMANKAALRFYQHLKAKDNQWDLLGEMQTREELYDVLDYHRYEQQLDQLLAKSIKED